MKKGLFILSVVFLFLGFAGFMQNPVLGIFSGDPVINALHLLVGFLGIELLRQERYFELFAQIVGLALLAVSVLYIFPGIRLNMALGLADVFLHGIAGTLLLSTSVRERAQVFLEARTKRVLP